METHRRGSGNSLRAQINFHTPIEWARRTLSPSAFGFQNAKRCPVEGSYSSIWNILWDDPVKLTSGFCCIPG